jgi:hypothetical protein
MLHSSFNSLIYANYLRGIIQLALIGFKSVRVESLESTIFFIRDLLGRPPNQYPESLKSYHQIINESCPHLINEIVGGVVGISTRQPFPGSLYQAISATSLYLGDAAGVDNVLTLIANALQSLHVAYPDRLSAETTANLIESIRAYVIIQLISASNV